MGIADSRIAGVRGTGYTATTLHGNEVTRTIVAAAEELVNKGAGAIILGCAVSALALLRKCFGGVADADFDVQGMAPQRKEIEDKLRERVGKHIYLIDSVQAAIEHAAGLSRMKLAHVSV